MWFSRQTVPRVYNSVAEEMFIYVHARVHTGNNLYDHAYSELSYPHIHTQVNQIKNNFVRQY